MFNDQKENFKGAVRRKVLTTGAAALAGSALATTGLSFNPVWGAMAERETTVNPDAKLLDLCDHFHAIDRQAHELDDLEGKAADAEREAFWAKQEQLVEKMRELQATTLAGFRGLARAYAAWEGSGVENLLNSGVVADTLLGTLLRDLGAVRA